MSKTPKTDRALDDVAGILRRLPASEARREELGARVAEMRSVPGSVARARCPSSMGSCGVGCVAGPSGRVPRSCGRHPRERDEIADCGIEAELNQARAAGSRRRLKGLACLMRAV